MAFICEACGKSQRAGTKAAKIVTEIRNVTYVHERDEEGRYIGKTTTGTEIVKELTVCPACAVSHDEEPRIVGHKRIGE